MAVEVFTFKFRQSGDVAFRFRSDYQNVVQAFQIEPPDSGHSAIARLFA